MKLLFTALLCLLLAGCSGSSDQAALPTEAPRMSQEAADSLQNRYGDVVEAVSLPLKQVQQLWRTEHGCLLLGNRELLLTDSRFQPIASCMLDFDPQIAVHRSILSAFDSQSRQLLLLTPTLEELRRLTLPVELRGVPFVSSDGNTVYYGTDGGIYSWDLISGIRRRIRESAYESQYLVGLHREDTVLQCRIRDGGNERDLFVDTQSGQLLQEMTGTARLLTSEDRYYCSFTSGSVENLVFGHEPENPQELFPAAFSAECRFLPESHGAVTLQKTETAYVLSYYTLEDGRLQDSLTLYQEPKTIIDGGSGTVWLLVRENGLDVLLKWSPGKASADETVYTDTYYTADHPDHAGLTLCRKYAQALSSEYGIEILLWKEAIATEPWDYTFEPEHRYPVLLSRLQTLEACLARYPETLLTQTAAHFRSLRICLVQSITGIAGEGSLSTATGIQFLNGSDAYVVLAAGPYLEQALYHELFHVMEVHILSCSSALDRWNELNPAGFSYDLDHSANSRRNSGVYLDQESRAFVDTYSMSFPKEDRARIFEYAMLEDSGHLFRSKIMQQKLSAICAGIREAYGLKKSDELFPWEQYLE